MDERYARQTVLKEIGVEGQKTLRGKVVAIIGLGGIGGIAANALARVGVGKLILVDFQDVELANLHRQILYREDDIEKSKVKIAEDFLMEANSEINVEKHKIELNEDNIDLLRSDLILDCTDNLETRYLINDYAVKNNIPWVFATAIRTVGMVHAFIPGKACFRCVFPNAKSESTCETAGIINTMPWLIGCLQSTEAIKILLGKKTCSELIRFNIWTCELEKIKIKKRKGCSCAKY